MPVISLGVIHILVALFFAVHVIRSGQQIFWLIILFSFPFLGSAAYFLAIYLPQSRLEHGAKKAVANVARVLDPTRELREARANFDYTPTAQNQMRLAQALLEAGEAEEAAVNYEACLKGPFASDLDIKFCAARAFVESGRYARAIEHLDEIRRASPSYRREQVSLLIARALAATGNHQLAKAEFEAAHNQFGSFEVRAEYAIWAITTGDEATAAKLKEEINQVMERWSKHTRELNKPLIRRLEAASRISTTRS